MLDSPIKIKIGERMKNKLAGVLGIAGMVMLVGCGGGSTTEPITIDPIVTDPIIIDPIGDAPVVSEPIIGEDTLKLTKQSDTVFTINWDKGYNGYSELLLDETADDRLGSRVMTDNSNGEHIIVCNFTGFNEDINEVSYLCEGTGPSVLGTPRIIRKGISMIADTPYYFSFNYGIDRINQGPIADLTYTAGGTLIVDEY